MRKLYTFGLLLLVSTACMEVPTGVTPSNPLTTDFVTVWDEFESKYPEFPLKGINWELMYGKYLQFAEEAETIDDVMMNAIFPMLAELKDRHLLLMNPQGDYIITYDPEITPNYNQAVLNSNYLGANGWNYFNRGVGFCNPDSLPYMAIKSWLPELNIERINEFISLCEDLPVLIIDVRMNGGGTNQDVGYVVGRFTRESILGWIYRERSGPDYNDCQNWDVINVPTGLFQYTGTVILLLGPASASTTEMFAARMNELPNVISIGDTTMGINVCSTWLEFSSGWLVKCGVWSARTADYEPIEGYGIQPDIFVEATQEDFDNGIDPIMDYAIDLMNELSQ